MRNTAKYPITAEEKQRALAWAVDQALVTLHQRGVGCTIAVALQELQKDLGGAQRAE